MKSFKKFFLENIELDEANQVKMSSLSVGDTVKLGKRFGGKQGIVKAVRKDGADIHVHGTETPTFAHHSNFTKISEEVELSENIKGWKHAASDIQKMRSAQGKTVKLVRLKKDGTENKMHDATKVFRSEGEAQEHHDRVVALNPKTKIAHNLYVDGKHVKTLGA